MHSKEKILDDIARVADGAAGIFSGLNQSIREDIKTRIDDMALRLDLVPREEFERIEALLAETRMEQERLGARIDALEKALSPQTKTNKKT